MYNAVIVGAGPAGLSLAEKLKREGWDCAVVEEHSAVGRPVNCTGLISRSGVQELGLDLSDCEINRIKGARIYSPNNEVLEVKKQGFVAHVIDREAFDRGFYAKAKKAGVDVKLDTRLLDIRNETVFVEHNGRGELIKGQIIVGADGVTSKTRGLMGINVPPQRLMHTYQVRARGSFDRDYVSLYLGGASRGFFAWVVPESNEIARIGLGTNSGNVKKAFDMFTAERGIRAQAISESSALIPIGEPLKEIVKDNLMLLGDAAFQTKATTGGGIITGLNAAGTLAELISSHFKNKTRPEDYWKMLKPLNNELNMHWKIRAYLNSLGDEKMDALFRKMKKAGMEEFLEREGDMDRPGRFMGKILRKPKMWGLFPEAMKVLR